MLQSWSIVTCGCWGQYSLAVQSSNYDVQGIALVTLAAQLPILLLQAADLLLQLQYSASVQHARDLCFWHQLAILIRLVLHDQGPLTGFICALQLRRQPAQPALQILHLLVAATIGELKMQTRCTDCMYACVTSALRSAHSLSLQLHNSALFDLVIFLLVSVFDSKKLLLHGQKFLLINLHRLPNNASQTCGTLTKYLAFAMQHQHSELPSHGWLSRPVTTLRRQPRPAVSAGVHAVGAGAHWPSAAPLHACCCSTTCGGCPAARMSSKGVLA